jgi:uncharacterized surface protein with fasciclin (FAS1) repeats
MKPSRSWRVGGFALLVLVSAALTLSVGAGAGMSADAPTKNIVDTLTGAGNFKTFVSMLQQTGVDKTLATGGPYTVFAPTDDAFARAPASMLNAFAHDPALLESALLYDVVPGSVTAADAKTMSSAPTLNGARLGLSVVGDAIYANNAKVASTELTAANGVVQPIDTVLMPLASPSGTTRRAAYCAVTGNTARDGKPIPAGRFLNLLFEQPAWDYHYAGARPAIYVQGHGLTCAPPPAGYTQKGTAPDELHVPGRLYPYYAK